MTKKKLNAKAPAPPLRIRPMSDLHIEFGGVTLDDSVNCDVVVLAGDIGVIHRQMVAEWARKTFPSRRIVQILGNHEHYKWRGGMDNCIAQARKEAAEQGVDFLECDRVDIGGVRFLGCTLWTDYELYGKDKAASARSIAAAVMIDHRLIAINADDGKQYVFRPVNAADIFKRSVAWLDEQLTVPFDGPTVVVTHHAPHPKANHAHYIGSENSPAFVSNLTWLIEKHEPAVWISGHTHMSHRFHVGKTLLLSNQRGYRDEPEVESAPFVPDLVIEVER